MRVLREAEGRPAELRGLMVNITRRKKVERRLCSAKQALAAELANLKYVHSLFERLSPTAELRPLLDEILGSVASIVGAEKGGLYVRDGHPGDWCLGADLGLPEGFVDLVAKVKGWSPWRGRVLAVDEPLIVADVLPLAIGGDLPAIVRAGGFRGIFSLPILTSVDDALGCVAILFDEPHRPPERQVRLAERYIGRAAEFIANALLRRDANLALRGEPGDSAAGHCIGSG